MDHRHYYDDYRPRRSGFLGTILVAIISAVVGGIIALTFFPYFNFQQLGSVPETGRNPLEQRATPPVTINPGENPVIAIADQVGPAVVAITNIQGKRGQFFFSPHGEILSGSGVIFDSKKGYIVTNFHVVDNADRLIVTINEDRQYEAAFVAGDRRTDLAVIRIKARDLPEAKFGDSSKLRVGETAIAIGNPLGRFARSVTVGVISALNRELTIQSADDREITLQVLQTDAAINPGNSGGALVNTRGEVIGINSAKIARQDVEGLGFAIPINDARPIIEQLISQGYVSRPFIGIFDFREISEQMSRWYDLPVGIYVGGVVEGGPAAKAGMKEQDVIVALDDQKIETTGDLYQFLNKHTPGDHITATIVRDGKKIKLELTLGEMPR